MELRFWCSYAAGLCTYDLYFPDPPRGSHNESLARPLDLSPSSILLASCACCVCGWVADVRLPRASPGCSFFLFLSEGKGISVVQWRLPRGEGFRIRWVSFLGTSGLWIDMIVISGMGSDRCTDGLGGKLSIRSCRWSRFMYVGRVSSIIY